MKKKIFQIFILMIFSWLLCGFSCFAKTNCWYYVSSDFYKGIAFREKADGNSKMYERLPYGTEFWVTDEKGNWLKSKVNGNDGWIHKDYVSKSYEGPGCMCWYTVSSHYSKGIAIRDDVDGELITRIPYGTDVYAYRYKNEWFYVLCEEYNVKGWMHSGYLKYNDSKFTTPSQKDTSTSSSKAKLVSLDNGKTYKYDLNGDGKKEKIKYLDGKGMGLYINDKRFLPNDDIYLLDLNPNDKYIEIVKMKWKRNDDTIVYRYSNKKLKKFFTWKSYSSKSISLAKLLSPTNYYSTGDLKSNGGKYKNGVWTYKSELSLITTGSDLNASTHTTGGPIRLYGVKHKVKKNGADQIQEGEYKASGGPHIYGTYYMYQNANTNASNKLITTMTEKNNIFTVDKVKITGTYTFMHGHTWKRDNKKGSSSTYSLKNAKIGWVAFLTKDVMVRQ